MRQHVKTVGHNSFNISDIDPDIVRQVGQIFATLSTVAGGELGALSFNERLRRLREDSSPYASAAELGRAVGIERRKASRLETTQKTFEPQEIVALAAALNVSTDYLLTGNTDSTGESTLIAELRQIEREGLLTAPARRRLLKAAYAEVEEAAAERVEASSSYAALMADLRKRAEAEGRDSVLPLLDELAAQPPTTHRDPGPPAQEAVS